jgi:hypothetical protein|tara:strand:+ start:1192 stop:1698 length:507 start_codon:yes stop_codon:yes gene_type:complete
MSKTRIKNEKALEEQIAFLRWRRMQNERQIRHSLEQTRSLQTKDELMRVTQDIGSSKGEWMASVIKDELSRPLVISDEEIHYLQENEAKAKKQLKQFTEIKLGAIANIRRDLERQRQFISTDIAAINNYEKRKGMFKIEKKTKKTLKEIDNRRDLVKTIQAVPKLFET